MAICREFYFPSSDGSSRIHAAEWMPESGEIIGVLQIAHGVAEYGMRYAPFAEFMTEHGFAVVANDHLGHGLSAEKDADTLYFGPRDGWKHVVDDMYALRCRTKEKYPDVPYFLMGHSMGSFLTRTYLIRYPGTVDAAIIMGTGYQSPAIVTGGRAIAKAAGKRHGFKAHSPRVEALAFGAYNKAFAPNRTEVDWLSASDNNVDAYIADPLCGQKASIGLFYEMLGGIRFISTPKNIASMNRNTPILFISGDKDPVGEMGKGVKRAYEAFRRAGLDPDFYTTRGYGVDELLPWQTIDVGVTTNFLLREREKALRSESTPDCRTHCNGCGARRLSERGLCDESPAV